MAARYVEPRNAAPATEPFSTKTNTFTPDLHDNQPRDAKCGAPPEVLTAVFCLGCSTGCAFAVP